MTAQARSRAAILVLACLGHVGLIVLLVGGFERLRYPAPNGASSEPLVLTLLDNLVRPEPRPAEVPAPVLTPPSEIFTGPVPEIDSTGSAFAPPVSDSVPWVDWEDERRREVANVVAREGRGANAAEPANPVNLAHPASLANPGRLAKPCAPARARAAAGAQRDERSAAGESGRFDGVAALAQGCEPARGAQHVVE